MKSEIVREVELTKGVTAELNNGKLLVKGKAGQLERNFSHPKIILEVTDKAITLKSSKASKKEKTVMGSFESHIKNMIDGINEPHVYKLKICSSHFPMNVTISGQELVIKNLFGESVPRRVPLAKGVNVKVDGQEIIVTSPDKELAGQVAGRIELACKVKRKDIRIFQDGCYIVEKAGKVMS